MAAETNVSAAMVIFSVPTTFWTGRSRNVRTENITMLPPLMREPMNPAIRDMVESSAVCM